MPTATWGSSFWLPVAPRRGPRVARMTLVQAGLAKATERPAKATRKRPAKATKRPAKATKRPAKAAKACSEPKVVKLYITAEKDATPVQTQVTQRPGVYASETPPGGQPAPSVPEPVFRLAASAPRAPREKLQVPAPFRLGG